tara:strand:- start:228 stop:350 length:123 start_codon:yes stop_codon:yes gene_type:complete
MAKMEGYIALPNVTAQRSWTAEAGLFVGLAGASKTSFLDR